MNNLFIGILIGIPIGVVAWFVGLHVMHTYQKSKGIGKYCEVCGREAPNYELFICEGCINILQEGAKGRLADKMFKSLEV